MIASPERTALMASAELSERSQPLKNPEVVFKELGSEAVLYHPGRHTTHLLNRTARNIWELCDGHHSPTEIEAALRARFNVPGSRDLRQDLDGTLRDFLEKGLVKLDSAE
jgi:PqqD family protein of HPr-rel-A system